MSTSALSTSQDATLIAGPTAFRSQRAMWLLVTVILGTLFFVNGHDLTRPRDVRDDFTISEHESAAAVQTGSAKRRVAYLALGVFGAFLLLKSYGRRFTFADPLACAILLYLGYCACSVLWSIEPSLTIRRVAILACCACAVLGVTRQLERKELAWLAMTCSLAFVVTGLAAEISLGVFKPWASGYRFAGTVHPNSQGQLCGLLCLSSFAVWSMERRGRWLIALALLLGLSLLLLTKSRTSCLCLLIGAGAFWIPFARAEKAALIGVGLPFAVCLLALVATVFGVDVGDAAASTLTLGRTSQLGSFSGRMPLWSELAQFVTERPLLGHGYLTFWTPWRIETVSAMFQWTIPDAHNTFLDTLLNIGLLGGLLLGACVTLAMTRAVRLYLRTGDAAYGYFLAFFVYSLAGAFFESGFAQPLSLAPFVAACCMVHLGCCVPAEATALDAARRRQRDEHRKALES